MTSILPVIIIIFFFSSQAREPMFRRESLKTPSAPVHTSFLSLFSVAFLIGLMPTLPKTR